MSIEALKQKALQKGYIDEGVQYSKEEEDSLKEAAENDTEAKEPKAWKVDNPGSYSGNLVPVCDNMSDIGTEYLRPRKIHSHNLESKSGNIDDFRAGTLEASTIGHQLKQEIINIVQNGMSQGNFHSLEANFVGSQLKFHITEIIKEVLKEQGLIEDGKESNK